VRAALRLSIDVGGVDESTGQHLDVEAQFSREVLGRHARSSVR
jgi:hypothetical protein